jgi:hypothetical protein
MGRNPRGRLGLGGLLRLFAKLAGISAVLFAFIPAFAGNVIANPGFEYGTLSYWITSNSGLITVTNEKPHSGNYAIFVGGGSLSNAQLWQNFIAPTGQSRFSVWNRVKCPPVGTLIGGTVGVFVQGNQHHDTVIPDQSSLQKACGGWNTGTTPMWSLWTKVSGCTSNLSGKGAGVMVTVLGADSGVVEFDDFSLAEDTTCPAPSTTPQNTPKYRGIWQEPRRVMGSGGGTDSGVWLGSTTLIFGVDGKNTLHQGDSIYSEGGEYRLVMQDDGNLVLYAQGPVVQRALWNSQTAGNPGAYAVMQADGNFVVFSSSGSALWSSGTSGHPGAYLALQDDSNLIVYSQDVSALWSTGIQNYQLNAGQVLRPGWSLLSNNGVFVLTMQTDGNLVMYKGTQAVWSSNTAGNANAYATMQNDGNFVVYNSYGSALWYTNTWGNSGAYAVMQNDGNFVVYNSSGRALWSTGQH